jgi:uncharacterized protein YlxP (DUF503 family)
MFVGVATFTVIIPFATSLKAKRSVVNSIKGRLQTRAKVAVAEVGDSERWQRADIAVSTVGNEASYVEELLASVRRIAESSRDGEVVDFRGTVVPWSERDR